MGHYGGDNRPGKVGGPFMSYLATPYIKCTIMKLPAIGFEGFCIGGIFVVTLGCVSTTSLVVVVGYRGIVMVVVGGGGDCEVVIGGGGDCVVGGAVLGGGTLVGGGGGGSVIVKEQTLTS